MVEELREKIADEIYEFHLEWRYGCKQEGHRPRFTNLNKNIQKQLLGWADQILALIPAEEEIGKQIEAHGDICFNTGITEGKMRERERITSKFDNEYEVIQTFGKPSPYITFKVKRDEWQALKEGK